MRLRLTGRRVAWAVIVGALASIRLWQSGGDLNETTLVLILVAAAAILGPDLAEVARTVKSFHVGPVQVELWQQFDRDTAKAVLAEPIVDEAASDPHLAEVDRFISRTIVEANVSPVEAFESMKARAFQEVGDAADEFISEDPTNFIPRTHRFLHEYASDWYFPWRGLHHAINPAGTDPEDPEFQTRVRSATISAAALLRAIARARVRARLETK